MNVEMKRLDVNSASLLQLKTLPGVGSVIAQAIVAARPFRTMDELLDVKGIGANKYAALMANNLVCLSSESGDTVESASSSEPLLVDLNTASSRALERIKGVGPILAQRIVDARPFHQKEDLLGVKGIAASSYQKLHRHFCVGEMYISSDGSSYSVYDEWEDETSSENDEEEQEQDDNTSAVDLTSINIRSIQKHRRMRKRGNSLHMCCEVKRNIRESVFMNLPTTNSNVQKAGVLLVASWNIRNISRRKDIALLQRIADIISEFDLVALQEVRDTIVLKRLKTMLPGWDYVVSAPVGRESTHAKKRTEHFAFIYRRCVVQLTGKCSLFVDPDNVFVRPPFVAHFQANEKDSTTKINLTLVNVHVSFGEKEDRHREIFEIKRLAAEIAAQIPTDGNVVVLGDFNLPPQDIFARLNTQMMALIRAPLSTTVFGKLYDNIWINRATLNRKYAVESGVYRIDWRYYPQSKLGVSNRYLSNSQLRRLTIPKLQSYMARMHCAYELSDHCPVWVAFTEVS